MEIFKFRKEKIFTTGFIFFGLLAVLFSCSGNKETNHSKKITHESLTKLIKTTLDTLDVRRLIKDPDEKDHLSQEIKRFYRIRKYQPAWVEASEWRPQSDSLLLAIRDSEKLGYRMDDYDFTEIERLRQQAYSGTMDSSAAAPMVDLDLRMTTAYFTYASHLYHGRVDATQIDTTWFIHPEHRGLAIRLAFALDDNRVKNALFDLMPDDYQFKMLSSYLREYQATAEAGGFPLIISDKVIEKGDTSEAVKQLRQRLYLSGDISGLQLMLADSNVYNEQVESALQNFQQRHGLTADGKVGPSTLEMLNKPVEHWIQIIEINLERLRQIPKVDSGKYIEVNIPDYSLTVYKDNKIALKMPVIIGRAYDTNTPVFFDSLEYIVFSPTWTVPLKIAREEFLPKLKKDSTYISRNHYRIYDNWDPDAEPLQATKINWKEVEPSDFNYRIVQQPGEFNALGSIKFIFPNNLSIYLHDTPADYLFKRDERDFSHGCIRVEKPVKLAEYLLADNSKWNPEKIREYMHKDEPVNVHLPEKIPVHIIYQTAWVNENGILNFREDIYGHDKKQIEALEQKEKLL
ncbi:MAG: L,D-transpeptidase family protein [Calditrichia bacterium]